MTQPTVNEQIRDSSKRHTQRRIRKNAVDLRRLADEYDRIADDLDRVPSPGRSNHVSVAKDAIHAHAMWVANAQLESAVESAAEADVAAALVKVEAES